MNTDKDNKQRTCIENKSLAVRINIEPILAEPDQGTFHSAKESWNLHPVLKLQLLPPHCPCLTQSPIVTHILGVRVKQLLKTKWPCVNKPLQAGKLTLTFSFACLLPTSKAFTPGKPRIPAGVCQSFAEGGLWSMFCLLSLHCLRNLTLMRWAEFSFFCQYVQQWINNITWWQKWEI